MLNVAMTEAESWAGQKRAGPVPGSESAAGPARFLKAGSAPLWSRQSQILGPAFIFGESIFFKDVLK
jgi:hypothetical protein